MPIPKQVTPTPALPRGDVTGRLPPQPVTPESYDYTREELFRAADAADRAGDKVTAQALMNDIAARRYRESQSDLLSTVVGATQGATLGLGEEMSAGIMAAAQPVIDPYLHALQQKFRELTEDQSVAIPRKSFLELVDERDREMWEGKDYMQRYRDNLARYRGVIEAARQEDPWLTMGGEVAGGAAATYKPAASLIHGATTKLGQLGRLAGLGAAEGAVAGYGHSEAAPIQALREQEEPFMDMSREDVFNVSPEASAEIREATGDIGTGTVLGMGLATALPAGGSVARAIGRKVFRPFTKEAELTEIARLEVADAIKRDILDDGLPLDQAIRKAQQELDEVPGMTAADIGHHTKDLTEKLVNRGMSGSGKMADFMRRRNIEQWKRMHPRLAEALTGDRDSNFYAAQKQVLNDIQTKSKAAYDIAYLQPVRISAPMRQILDNRIMQKSLDLTNEMRALDNKPPLTIDDLITGRVLGTQEIDEIVKGMDGLVNAAYRDPARGGLGKKLQAQRDAFTDAVYQQNPDYAKARRTFANEKLNEEALDMGRKILSENPDMIRDVVRGMSPTERQHLKIGVLQAVVQRLGNKAETADLTKDIWSKPNARDALRVAFGGKKKFEDFMKYIEQEQNMYQTFYQAVGNSQTARRLAQQHTARGGGLAYALGYFTAPHIIPHAPMGLVGAGTRRAYEAVASPTPAEIEAMHFQSDELARMLQSRDLESLMRPHTVGGLLEYGIPVAPAAAAGGIIGSGVPHGADYGGY